MQPGSAPFEWFLLSVCDTFASGVALVKQDRFLGELDRSADLLVHFSHDGDVTHSIEPEDFSRSFFGNWNIQFVIFDKFMETSIIHNKH